MNAAPPAKAQRDLSLVDPFPAAPIVERRLIVFGTPLASFDDCLPRWFDIAAEAFPHKEVGQQWSFSIDPKAEISKPVSQVKFFHRSYAQTPNQERLREMRPLAEGLLLTVLKTKAAPTTFPALLNLAEHWVPLWAKHFNVSLFRGLKLRYKFLFSQETTPAAVSKDRSMKIDKWLTYFSCMPGRFNDVVGPFSAHINLSVEPARNAEFQFRVESADEKKDGVPFGVAVWLSIDTFEHTRKLDFQAVIDESKWANLLLIEQIEAYFTNAAKQLFR